MITKVDKVNNEYCVRVYYPTYLEDSEMFQQEIAFTARSIHRVVHSCVNGMIKVKTSSLDSAKVIQDQFIDVIRRFMRY